MADIWITSDTHFCHNKDFIYGVRNFADATEMSEAIVENWNKIVKPNDTVYLLGDIMLKDNENGVKYFNQLQGNIFVVWGNHDTEARQEYLHDHCKFDGGVYATRLRVGDICFYLSHFPMLTANYDDKHFNRHIFNVHGHTHQRDNWLDKTNPFMYHGGLDSHNCTPVNVEEVIADIRNRWNALGGPNAPSLTFDHGYTLPTGVIL